MAHLQLFVLGPPRIELDAVKVEPGRRKAVALLSYLAVTAQLHSRDTLAALLWPNYGEEEARASLRRSLAALKAVLHEDWLIANRESVGLRFKASLWVDVSHFSSRLAECRTHGHAEAIVCDSCLLALSDAARHYQGDFLSGFNLPDCPEFDEWLFFQREQLRQQFAGVLERLARGYGERGDFDPAIAYTRRWLQLNPLEEAAHRQLMRLYSWSGQRTDALRQFALCQELLREINAEPDQETVTLFQALQAGQFAPWTPPTTSPTALQVPPQLPLPAAPFIGRSAEIETIVSRLHDSTCRLITLIGPGGTGKTQLALRVGQLQIAHFVHGVYFVPLAALTTASLLISAIADSIGFTFYTQGDPKTQLFSYLSGKHMLLIVDNFEHLLEGAPLVSELLENAPALKVICTSRERLNIRDEWLMPVLEMNYPRESDTASPHQYDAVQLFIQRARAIQPDFDLAQNQSAVIRICQLVQGMPLALDLAAGWLHLLSASQIADRLAGNLDLLVSSSRDLPERHRNIRLILDETWQLLSEAEQELLRQLAIFRNSFSLEAMEQITQQPLPVLASLIGKALVRREPQDRYSLHELLRQYATEQIPPQSDNYNQTMHRFCAYYTALMAAQETALHSDEQKAARAVIDVEIDNIRHAWQLAAEHGLADSLDQMMVSVERYYEARGWLKERADLFSTAFEHLRHAHPTNLIRARLQAKRGWSYLVTEQREAGYSDLRESLVQLQALPSPLDTALAMIGLAFGLMTYERQYDEATTLLQDSLVLLEPLRERRAREAQAEALLHLGRIASLTGGFDKARSYYEQSLALGQRLGNPLGVSEALSAIGVLAIMRETFAEAQHWLEEALVINQRYDHKLRMVKDLHRLAVISMRQQQHEPAIRYYERCLTLYRELNDRKSECACLLGLGVCAYYKKDYEPALHYYREALALAREIGDQEATANALSNIGIIYWEQGSNYTEAKRLTQESLALHRRLGFPSMVATTLVSLGTITYSCHEAAEAYRYLWEALQITHDLKLTSQLLNACSWIPFCLASMGDLETGYVLYRLMLLHPEFSIEAAIWQELAARCFSDLPAEVRAAAEERLTTATLDSVVAALLEHPPTN